MWRVDWGIFFSSHIRKQAVASDGKNDQKSLPKNVPKNPIWKKNLRFSSQTDKVDATCLMDGNQNSLRILSHRFLKYSQCFFSPPSPLHTFRCSLELQEMIELRDEECLQKRKTFKDTVELDYYEKSGITKVVVVLNVVPVIPVLKTHTTFNCLILLLALNVSIIILT